MIESFASLWEYLQLVLAYISPPVVAIFIIGLFYPRANANGGFYSLVIGYAIIILFIILKMTDAAPAITDIHFLIQVPIFTAICMMLNVSISNMYPAPPPEKIEGMIWTTKIYTDETAELKLLPWYQNYRILSVILLLLTALIVIWFW